MDTTRKQLLAQALQRNAERMHGKQAAQMRPVFASSLSKASSKNISIEMFLDVEETARLKSTFWEDAAQAQSLSIPAHHERVAELCSPRLNAIFISLTSNWGDEKIALFSSLDDVVGAVVVPLHYVLDKYENIWAHLQQDLCMISTTSRSGLRLEESFSDEEGFYTGSRSYDIWLWGHYKSFDADNNLNTDVEHETK